jgi:uroporphyrinogen decarboxylase
MIKQIRKPCDGVLTPRERFVRQMHHQPVDRTFNMEFGYWDENFYQWRMFRDNGIQNNAEADVFFGFDPIRGIGGRVFMDPQFDEVVLGRKDEQTIIMQNKDGLIVERPDDQHSTISRYLKSPVTAMDDWQKLKRERFDVQSPSRRIDVSRYRQIHGPDAERTYPLGVNCGSMIGRIRDLLTFEGLCYAYYDEPEMLEDMVETCCRLVLHFLDQVLDQFAFDFASGWEDICFKNGPILPPAFFEDVIKPRYERIHRRLADHGIDIWYTDCDGDVRPILPALMSGGINCLFPFEVNSCAHPGELLDQHAGLRIMGGVDKMELAKGPEAIDAYLASLLPYVRRGGYIPFCDHRCPPNVKEEDYLYYLDQKRKLFTFSKD